MKIIALQGKDERGKTTTLKMLINIIKVRDDSSLVAKRTKYISSRDTWAIFELCGKTVGITTRGDTRKVIQYDLADMQKAVDHIDVFVCAIHNSTDMENFAKELAGDDTVLIIGKAYVCCSNNQNLQDSQRELANAQQAVCIMEAIERI